MLVMNDCNEYFQEISVCWHFFSNVTKLTFSYINESMTTLSSVKTDCTVWQIRASGSCMLSCSVPQTRTRLDSTQLLMIPALLTLLYMLNCSAQAEDDCLGAVGLARFDDVPETVESVLVSLLASGFYTLLSASGPCRAFCCSLAKLHRF